MACPLSDHLRYHGQIVPARLQDNGDKEHPLHDVTQGTKDAPASSQSPAHDGIAEEAQVTATGDKQPATDATFFSNHRSCNRYITIYRVTESF